MFSSKGLGSYVAEKAERETGWLFPVGDEIHELGYTHMFEAMDKGEKPMETFYDGYVINAIIDACYKSAKSKLWEPVILEDWRFGKQENELENGKKPVDEKYVLIKEERLPDGQTNVILKDKNTGEIIQKIR